jgi:hypothetical protein
MPRRPSTFAARKPPEPGLVPRVEHDGKRWPGWVRIANRVRENKPAPSRPVFVCTCGETMTLKPYAIAPDGYVTPTFTHDRGELSERVVAEVRRTYSKAAAERKLVKLQAQLDELQPNKGCGFRSAIRLQGYRGPAWAPGQDWQDDQVPAPGARFVPPKARYQRDPIDKAHDQALVEDRGRG